MQCQQKRIAMSKISHQTVFGMLLFTPCCIITFSKNLLFKLLVSNCFVCFTLTKDYEIMSSKPCRGLSLGNINDFAFTFFLYCLYLINISENFAVKAQLFLFFYVSIFRLLQPSAMIHSSYCSHQQ